MPTAFAWKRKKRTFSRLRAGLAIGLLLVAAVVAGASYADGMDGARAPLSTLVKFDNRDFEITAAGWVSLDPIASTTVRKIGYGHVREVNIATTSTGTYSSDGMMSPHVIYPGISVRPAHAESSGPSLSWQPIAGTYLYTFGRSPSGAKVFNALTPRGSTSCVSQRGMLSCSVN